MTNLKKSFLLLIAGGIGVASLAQMGDQSPNGWHLKDPKTSGYYGISLDKAYDFVKGKKSKTVVVAVIDSGIDTAHEDLKPVLWTNRKEIPGNGIDDDKNGYIDDVHGWNFLGNKDGRNVGKDSYEAARVYHLYKSKFENLSDPSALTGADAALYKDWKRAESDIAGDPAEQQQLSIIRRVYNSAAKSDSVLQTALGKKEFKASEVESYAATTPELKSAKASFLLLFQGLQMEMTRTNKEVLTEISNYLTGNEEKATALTKAPRPYRAEVVGDNEEDINDKYYGNNDLMATDPMHGTHVSGIIAAVRNNKKGMDGIADNVRIMTVRAVPDGDEHDKDIALAIRYAVDNGAKIINMSFGKGFSPHKDWVDDAVKYAEAKNVLLVHAAGNDGKNNDSSFNFPNPVFQNDGSRATDWLTIGASGDPKNGGLTASFSNYGKNEVDVFSPGVRIYSTLPGGNKYGKLDGTSMASPVTAGLAAFLLEYYPKLTAVQLKYIIENSAVAPAKEVELPGADQKMVKLSDISKSGGIINAYEAVKMADAISSGKIKMPASADTKALKSF